jgi:hypothetical protein
MPFSNSSMPFASAPCRSKPNTLAIVHLNPNHWGSGNFNSPYSDFTFPLWQQIRPRQEPFSSIAVWGPARLNLATGGEVRNANAICVSGDFFRALHPRRSHGGVAIRVVLRASRDHAEISPSHDEQTMSNRTLPSAYLNDPRPDINSSQPPKPPYNNRVCVAWHPSRRSRFSSPFPSGHSVAEVTPAVAGMPAVSAVDIPVSAVDTAAAALAEAM